MVPQRPQARAARQGRRRYFFSLPGCVLPLRRRRRRPPPTLVGFSPYLRRKETPLLRRRPSSWEGGRACPEDNNGLRWPEETFPALPSKANNARARQHPKERHEKGRIFGSSRCGTAVTKNFSRRCRRGVFGMHLRPDRALPLPGEDRLSIRQRLLSLSRTSSSGRRAEKSPPMLFS